MRTITERVEDTTVTREDWCKIFALGRKNHIQIKRRVEAVYHWRTLRKGGSGHFEILSANCFKE